MSIPHLLLKKEMATHSSILSWKGPWTEEAGGLQSSESQSRSMYECMCHMHTYWACMSACATCIHTEHVWVHAPHAYILSMYECMCHICLFTYLLKDTWVVSTFQQLRIMLPWTWVFKYLFRILLLTLSGIYPEEELLGHVLYCLIFGGGGCGLASELEGIRRLEGIGCVTLGRTVSLSESRSRFQTGTFVNQTQSQAHFPGKF